ncbi:MAG: hypothetical protein DRP85_00870 [Candidatus Makaraimicrobium thalassicum]|nr:MAG: hypothetical protein DRP85_00870 [Candidatus Omnitrophota bacterium]
MPPYRAFDYSPPQPFLLPARLNISTGWYFQEKDYLYLPIDGRYLEEIMWYINQYRKLWLKKSERQFNLYDDRGIIKGKFYPTKGYSYLNGQIPIGAFPYYVEEIKQAIEEIIVPPDSLRAHFGRCFNAPYYGKWRIVSPGLYNKYPDSCKIPKLDGIPFYNFPENISGEALFKTFNKFNYYIPSPSHPARQILVDAFATAKKKLQELPLFERMRAGQWALSFDELVALMGLCFYSKSPDSRYLPGKDADGNYIITDHKRILWFIISFVIQMLRFQPPIVENFMPHYPELDGRPYVSRTWTNYGFAGLPQVCSQTYFTSPIRKAFFFERSGKWGVMNHVISHSNGGVTLIIPDDYYGKRCYIKGKHWGCSPSVTHSAKSKIFYGYPKLNVDIYKLAMIDVPQVPDAYFYYHKFSELIVDGGGTAGGDPTSQSRTCGFYGYVTRHSYGSIGDHPYWGMSSATCGYPILSFNSLPFRGYLWDAMLHKESFGLNVLTNITLGVVTRKSCQTIFPPYACSRGNLLEKYNYLREQFFLNCQDCFPVATINYVAILDDNIHRPEEFYD